MGFHIPASDYAVERLSLDNKLIPWPTSTYIKQFAETIWRAGIMKDAMLVVDSAATRVDSSIVVCQLSDELRFKRLRLSSGHCLEKLNYPDRNHVMSAESAILRVVTYIIRFCHDDPVTAMRGLILSLQAAKRTIATCVNALTSSIII